MFSRQSQLFIGSFALLFLISGCATTQTGQSSRPDSSPGTQIASPEQKQQQQLDYWFVSSGTEKELRAQQKTLEDELEALRNTLGNRSDQIDRFEQQSANLEDSLDAKSADYNDSQKTLRNLQKIISRLESKQEKLRSRLSSLRSKLSEKQESYAEQVDEFNQTIDSQEKTISSQKETLGELRSTRKKLRTRISDLKSELDTREARIAELEQSIEESEQATVSERQTFGDLKKDLNDAFNLVQTKRVNSGLLVNVEGGVLFPSGDRRLDQSDRATLRTLANVLEDHGTRFVSVLGHADNTPVGSNYSSNWELSADRATSVVEYLVDEQNLDESRIATTGLGDKHPNFGNESAEIRQQNRRVEFLIGPEESRMDELPGTVFSRN